MNSGPILVVLFLLCALLSCKTEEEILDLQEGKIESEFHREHTGQALFLEQAVRREALSPDAFIHSIVLEDGMDFNVMLFLEKTLTYYQKQLAPALSVNEFCKRGNFHITFYVDGKEIYQEALTPGAGSCWFKNSTTAYRIPFLSSTNEDSWGRFLWMRFMKKEGGEEALEAGRHRLRVEFRPYVEVEEMKIGELIAAGELDVQLSKKEIKEKDLMIQRIRPNSGWQVSEASYDQEKIRQLNKKIAQEQFREITSLIVIQEGDLLIEEYFNEADRKTLHDTRSVGKSFASALTGIAIKEGHLADAQVRISDFYKLKNYKNYHAEKENITLQQLLSMSCPLDGNDMNAASPGNEENMYPTDDWVKFTLDLPVRPSQGEAVGWNYFTAGVVLLGDILHQSVPEGLEQYSKMKLFGPLKVDQYQWQYTPQGVANTAGGLRMTALDLARFGQLYQDRGRIDGQQVIPEEWVAASLSRIAGLPESAGGGAYGYLFWIKHYEIDGQVHEVAYASGNGGNKIFIFKDLPYVIVITATAYNQPYAHVQVDKMMQQYILPALLVP